MPTSEIVQLIMVALAVMTTIANGYSWITRRGERRADEAGKLTSTAMTLVDRLQTRVNELEADLQESSERIEAMEARIAALEVEKRQLAEKLKTVATAC